MTGRRCFGPTEMYYAVERRSADSNQALMYYAAERRSADLNQAFMELMKEGLTRAELAKLIAKRPATYGRFSAFLDKLP